MADPIEVERNFQEVMARFESALSIRHRYRLFNEFAGKLEGSFKKYESYILQLLEELPVYSGPLSWSGLDPAEIEKDLVLIETIRSAVGLYDENQNVNSVGKSLQTVCLLLYVCLNETEKANEYLKKVAGITFKESNEMTAQSTTRNDTLQMFYDYLSDKLQTGAHLSKAQYLSIKDILRQLSEIHESADEYILVPVVENYARDELRKYRYGRLRKMKVELYGEAESSDTDQLIWVTNIYGADTLTKEKNKDQSLASRKLYRATHSSRGSHKYFKGGIRFENRNAIHNGNSANLGISALWYIQLLKANTSRERYAISNQTVITGDITQDGAVQKVNEESIGLKVKAAFFSWANVFVVPFSQRALAEKELQLLKKKYPRRRLSIIGVNHLREVFYDRRVASREVQSRAKYFLNRLKNEHSKYILWPSIILLLIIVGRLSYGPIDHNPQSFSYKGSSLIVENKNGFEIKRLEVGSQTASQYSSAGHIAAFPLALLIDITGDGINEVIYGKRNRLNHSNREVSDVTAYSISGDSIIWNNELTLDYDFPRQSGVTQQEMLIREIGLVETDESPKLVVNANSFYYFQTLLYLFDANTGESEGEYLHIGHIRDIIFEDMNGDNRDEVIFTGINNAYWLACVGVLDINRIHGHSPLTKDYKPAKMESANELHYILIPKTILAKYTNPIMKYNEGETIYFDVANKTIRALVEEARIPFRKQYGEVMISVSFNKNLEPIGVGTSDVYDILARDLYKEGEIEKVPDFDYFQSYKDSIRYWNGTTFVLREEYFND